mgnify:CR=1 FL=1|tara:strand:+ start:8061 stop:8288 length:228 start_codon:yes stop_codon:yes gene_type:complete
MNEELVKIRKILNDLFEVDIKEDITELKMGDLHNWDSMGNFSLLLEIEKNFDIKYSFEELQSIKSIKEIANSIKR